MKIEEIYELVRGAYSGAQAKELTTELFAYNRFSTNTRYEDGARYCARKLREIGCDDVRTYRYPIDGKRCYGNWKTPKHWHVRRARLQLRINGKWETFAEYPRLPTSLFVYCPPTDGEVTTELVPMGSTDTRGKLVYCPDGSGNRVRFDGDGALGVVSDYAPNPPGVRGPRDIPNAHRWVNDFLFEDTRGLVGFSLSRRQGARLRAVFKKQSAIPCRYRVDGRLGDGEVLCVSGLIRGAGRPDEEVVVAAHIYEVGANDNCSGVGGALEALRVINALIAAGRLPRPERSIRVLFSLEIIGFLAYFENTARPGTRYIAGVNPDMIGEYQKRCKSELFIYQSPDSNSTFADPLLIDFIRRSADASFRYALKGFIVNDNIVSDPAIGVPCPALIHRWDKYYHSDADSPDKVSPATMKIVGGAMAAYIYAAASLNGKTAKQVARICLRHADKRLQGQAKIGMSRARLRYLLDREEERLVSIEACTGVDLADERARLQARAAGLPLTRVRKARRSSSDVRKAGGMVPERTVIGPFTLQHLPPVERAACAFQPSWSNRLTLPVFWIDGKRTLLEIQELAEHEVGTFSLAELLAYFTFLEDQKLIRIRRHR